MKNLMFDRQSILAPLRSAVDFHPFLFLELHPRPPTRAIQGRERDENPLDISTQKWKLSFMESGTRNPKVQWFHEEIKEQNSTA